MFKLPIKRHSQQHQQPASTPSNEGFIYIRCGSKSANTVQPSWRPQLPLPREVPITNERVDVVDVDKIYQIENDMERLHISGSHKRDHSLNAASQLTNGGSGGGGGGGSSGKKWSFGRLFRKKKEVETTDTSSSEEDRRAGFVPNSQKPSRASNVSSTAPAKAKPKGRSTRGSRPIGDGANHNPPTAPSGHHVDTEFFLPVETVPAQEPHYQNQRQHQPPPPQQQQLQQLQLQPQQHYSQQYMAAAVQPQLHSRSANSLDRRSARVAHKNRSVQRLPSGAPAAGAHSSSEEEIISLNSSTFSKYRSDESIHSGGQGMPNGQSRRSRAARNERYYKRLSRDGEVSHGQVPAVAAAAGYAAQTAHHSKNPAAPLSIFQAPQQPVAGPGQRLRNTNSLQNVAPYVQWRGLVPPEAKNLQNSVNDSKRSISYDSHIHLQNAGGRLQAKSQSQPQAQAQPQPQPQPPPPPPRDPLRRVNMGDHLTNDGSGDLRPVSYAFDRNGIAVVPSRGLNARCVSDDRIWSPPAPHYHSLHSLNQPQPQPRPQPQLQQQPAQSAQNRRFITRAERDANPAKKSLPNGLDFHYVADAAPRSRKPIHMLEQSAFRPHAGAEEPPSSGILRTTKSGLPVSPTKTTASTSTSDFWKRAEGVDGGEADFKPRSSPSSSRSSEVRSYPMPMYSEVQKPNRKATPTAPPRQEQAAGDAGNAGNVVCASLHIKASKDNGNNYVELNSRNGAGRSRAAADHSPSSAANSNKYDEYVAEKREQHNNPLFDPPAPPQRMAAGLPGMAPFPFPRRKPANLEEAINELEAIYRSLGLSEEPEKKEHTPTGGSFEKFALAHAADYDEDEDSPAGEPDPIRDDVAYRNIKLANLQHKAADKQPPFGIPVGPVVPSPQTDYLHVEPRVRAAERRQAPPTPDVIKDDLAVRALRKDRPGAARERVQCPSNYLLKKNRATRTQSANIYSLIQRDAAKPSGGDLFSYLELSRGGERGGSMSDLYKTGSASDVPSTLKLLRNLKEQEQEQAQSKKQQQQQQQQQAAIPFRHPSQGGAISQLPEKLSSAPREDKDRQRAPVPLPRKSLTPEPSHDNAGGGGGGNGDSGSHQMEDALNKIAKDAQESSIKLSQEIQELRKGALLTASRAQLPQGEEEKLEKDLQEIEAVSEAAKRCGQMLLEALPEAHDVAADADAKSRKLRKEGTLIRAIDQVSEAANAVCEKILKDIVTTEPPVVVQDAVRVQQAQPKPEEPLVVPHLMKKLDPTHSEKIEAIATRCMRQISKLADGPAADYDSVEQTETAAAPVCSEVNEVAEATAPLDTYVSTVAELKNPEAPNQSQVIDEIDQIMKECEAQVRSSEPPRLVHRHQHQQQQQQQHQHQPQHQHQHQHQHQYLRASEPNEPKAAKHAAVTSSTTASSFSSSSDCLAKSSTSSASRRQSSSITSFNPYSSSDYVKSPSSEYHRTPSTDPIKTFSTTSYDVQSTTSQATPNITSTNSPFSYSPSPPRRGATATGGPSIPGNSVERGEGGGAARSTSPSQYNSSEELAMIFGIDEPTQPQGRGKAQSQQKHEQKQKQKLQSSGNCDTQRTVAVPGVQSPLPASASASVSASASASAFASHPCAQPAHLTNNPANSACESVASSPAPNPETVCVNVPCSPTTTSAQCPTNASPGLSTDPELDRTVSEELPVPPTVVVAAKGSPSFDRMFASKIRVYVDRSSCLSEEPSTVVGAPLTELDPLSSLEESSSNPDSGNVSLADFPLSGPSANANACLQLQTTYNSRFKVRNTFVSEVSLGRRAGVKAPHGEADFPPLPTAEELLESLRESENPKQTLDPFRTDRDREGLGGVGAGYLVASEEGDVPASSDSCNGDESYASLRQNLRETSELSGATSCDVSSDALSAGPQGRKGSIVFETPQLNMNILEERITYEYETDAEESSLASSPLRPDEGEVEATPLLLTQIRQCTAEVEKLNHALHSMTEARDRCAGLGVSRGREETDSVPLAERRLLRWQAPRSDGRIDGGAGGDGAGTDRVEKPSTSADGAALTMFGELQEPRNGLSLLEHIVVACTLGLISSDDLFTLFVVIVGVMIIVANALFVN